jgi:uncharacterized zinc-type alcohol dehydrogenase-like protein
MSTTQITGYAAKAVNQPLERITYDPPPLGEHDVRVAVTHCGVCHTDIHAIENYYNVVTYPLVPGHEIVGMVTETGKSVTEVKAGQRVGIGWQGRSCGKCEWCLRGEEQLCLKIVPDAVWTPYGGFSTFVMADSRFVYPLPEGMRSEVGAVLMCAGIATFNPLRKYRLQAAQKLGVVGVGGLGHLAIQFAKALGYKVTAISSSPQKKEEALAFGAQEFIHIKDTTALIDHEFAFDLILITASSNLPWVDIIDMAKKRGTLILVGFPDVNFNSTDLVAHDLTLTSSFVGNRATMGEMLAFAQEHAIRPTIEQMPMSKVNEALQRVKENKAHYRIVLVND